MKAPYKVLYSNDTTNITTCVSPYHAAAEPFRPEMLEATVDEVAGTGVEAHFIQLAHGQVPWYRRSKVYPIEEHHRWWREYFGADPADDPFGVYGVHEFLLGGGDPLQVFIDRCRQTGQAPFVSLRMNDVHHVEHVHTPGNTKGIHAISRFYAEHLDYRLGTDLRDWLRRTLDWTIPEVRQYMFSLIEEQCENYDIDGFELDFMRFPNFFSQERTTSEQRAQIMAAFIADVRRVLDRTAKSAQRRWLCVRIPAFTCTHDALGIDVRRWVDAGVDMVNLSYHYFTAQNGDLAAVRALVPDASVYVEMCHTTRCGPVVGEKGKYDNFSFRRTTPAQYCTTAHLAYAHELDGVSAFNFVYYREHGDGERGPFDEPPFHVFNHMADAEWLAKQPQHYILSTVWNTPPVPSPPLPVTLAPGQFAEFAIDIAPPSKGWSTPGRLRIQTEQNLDGQAWSATLNGARLVETDDRTEPYGCPYTPLTGPPQLHRAWIVPPNILKAGANAVVVNCTAGDGQDVKVVFIDLAIA